MGCEIVRSKKVLPEPLKPARKLPKHVKGVLVPVPLSDLPAYYQVNGLEPNGFRERHGELDVVMVRRKK